jgi:hypothetical protein
MPNPPNLSTTIAPAIAARKPLGTASPGRLNFVGRNTTPAGSGRLRVGVAPRLIGIVAVRLPDTVGAGVPGGYQPRGVCEHVTSGG